MISALADFIIHPSADGQRRAESHLARAGRVPPSVVAHLGIETAPPRPQDLPANLNLARPYFVTLGTIEPRKNHELLLDVWQRMGGRAAVPTLVVVGRRGWRNERVFARLDAMPAHVVELNDLSDGAVTALLQGAAGLLFPSYAEGFGLPPAEAASLGIPVVCADLPVYREFLLDYPVYLNATDMYLWETTIRNLTNGKDDRSRTDHSAALPDGLPTWESHFNFVLKVL